MVTPPEPVTTPPAEAVGAARTTAAGPTTIDESAAGAATVDESAADRTAVEARADAGQTDAGAGGTTDATMRGWFRLTLGLLAVVVGALWTLQGLGLLEDSVLSGKLVWAVVGPGLVLVGLVLLRLGLHARNRRTPPGSDASG